MGPLLQVVVSGNNGGEGIHFMVVDIVVTVLSWTSLASPKVANTYILKTANINNFCYDLCIYHLNINKIWHINYIQMMELWQI